MTTIENNMNNPKATCLMFFLLVLMTNAVQSFAISWWPLQWNYAARQSVQNGEARLDSNQIEELLLIASRPEEAGDLDKIETIIFNPQSLPPPEPVFRNAEGPVATAAPVIDPMIQDFNTAKTPNATKPSRTPDPSPVVIGILASLCPSATKRCMRNMRCDRFVQRPGSTQRRAVARQAQVCARKCTSKSGVCRGR